MVMVNEQQLMSLDAQIAQLGSALEHLKAARMALAGNAQPRPVEATVVAPTVVGRGRRSFGARKAANPAATKRVLSPAGRKRIAQAMKRRWAERRAQKNAQNPQVQELVHAASS